MKTHQAPSPGDVHQGTRPHQVEQLDQIPVAHADAAVGAGQSDGLGIGTAVDVDESAQAIHRSAPVAPGFQAGQPEDAGEYPVPIGKPVGQIRPIDLAGRSPAHEHGILQTAVADAQADTVASPRRAAGAVALAGSVAGGGDRIAPEHTISLHENEGL